MKKSFVAVGFIVSAVASFALMQFSSSFDKGPMGWSSLGEHMRSVDKAAAPMLDKCKLDRIQGRLKNREESVKCSNPTVREAFLKEGFTHVDKLDEFLTKKLELAKKADAREIGEDDLTPMINKELDALLAVEAEAEAASKK